MSKTSNTTLLAIIACVLWSTAFVGIKLGLPYTSPVKFAGIRFFLAGIMIFPLIRNKKQVIQQVKAYAPFILHVAIFQTFIQYLFFYLGLARVPAATGAIIIGAGPLFIALMSHFLMPNEKLKLGKTLAILLGFGGIVLVALSKQSLAKSTEGLLLGILFLLLCNINGGYINILIAKSKKPIAPLVLSSSTLTIGGLMLLASSLIFEPLEFSLKPLPYYLSLFWLSSLSAGAISIWTTLLKRPGIVVSDLNLWKFIVPVLGAVLAWIIIPEEQPQKLALVGMLLTALALLWVNYLNRMKRKAANKA